MKRRPLVSGGVPVVRSTEDRALVERVKRIKIQLEAEAVRVEEPNEAR